MRILGIITAVLVTYPAFAVDLAEQVTIRRTEYGIPHILGETEAAAAYGFAWAQCEDHFPLVYKAVVRGRSELSRYYGGSDGNINADFEVLHFRARKLVMDTYHELPADYRSIVEGFAKGINAYMDAHPAEVEPWMTPVTPHDIGAMRQVAVMRFAFDRGNIIRRFKASLEEKTDQTARVFEDDTEDMGSNTLALSPDRTTTGNAMLLNNPHQAWSEQANYYEAHVTVPGVYNFYGSTFVGGPILTTGFNRHLGWAHTVNYPDLEEIYEVTLDPEDPNRYLFDDGTVPLEHETVGVMTEDGSVTTRDLWWSPLGPVIHKTSDKAYILRSVGYKQYRAGLQWYRMGQATNLDEYRDVLRMQEIAMFNIGYADRDGNIMYLWNGTVPILPHKNSLIEAVPATHTNHIWTKVHPLEDLMQLTNPRGGYIQNCNSAPYLTNLHEPMNRRDYPEYFRDNSISLRTQHGLSLVHNDRVFSLEDLVDTKFSMKMLLADRVKSDLIALLEKEDLDREASSAVDMLKRWDNTVAADSVGSVLFKVWYDHYDESDTEFAAEWSEAEPMNTPRGIGDPARAVEAFHAALQETKDRWGSWRVKWGDVHRVRRGNVDVPVGGGGGPLGCFRVLKFAEADDGKLVANSGDSFIFAVEFGHMPRAYSVLAYSESGRQDSRHYNDQTRLYANNEMKRVAFTEDEIEDALLRSYRPGDPSK